MIAAVECVRLEVDEGVARITLDRAPLNVVTTGMLVAVSDAVRDAAHDRATRVIVLTGAGTRAFCAGVDVADHTAEHVHTMMAAFASAVEALMSVEVPVVAALNGAALGGGLELALACDIVLCRQGVLLGQPEVKLGVFPPVAAALLPRMIGRQAALDMILTGSTVTADEARALGLVTRVLRAETFTQDVAGYSAMLAGLSNPVLRLAKRAVTEGLERSVPEALAHADHLYLDDVMQLHDAGEGLAAFMAKRAPVWRHR